MLAVGCGSILGIGETTYESPDAPLGTDGSTPGGDDAAIHSDATPSDAASDVSTSMLDANVDAHFIDGPLTDATIDASPTTHSDALPVQTPDAAVPDAAALPDTPPDAAPDTTIDAPLDDCGWTFVPLNFDPCNLPRSNGVMNIDSAASYNTDTSSYVDSSGVPVTLSSATIGNSSPLMRMLVFDGLNIGADGQLTIVGTAALVIVVQGNFTISGGTIDASARVATGSTLQTAGPGGDDSSACAGGTGMAGEDVSTVDEGASGGSGGGYGSQSAVGGAGILQSGGAGKAVGPVGVTALVPLTGGCAGGEGGATPVGALDGPSGGAGGGAFQISAHGMISISNGASLRASGGGGNAGSTASGQSSGGGGGGSGGAILLEAAVVSIFEPQGSPAIAICANGGAGGEGGGETGGAVAGSAGSCSGTVAASDVGTQELGGDGGSGGYAGGGPTPGNPGFASQAAPMTFGGGGGGGGSVGRIRIRDATVAGPSIMNADISPHPLLH